MEFLSLLLTFDVLKCVYEGANEFLGMGLLLTFDVLKSPST